MYKPSTYQRYTPKNRPNQFALSFRVTCRLERDNQTSKVKRNDVIKGCCGVEDLNQRCNVGGVGH
jgi:hypothetical protein